MNFFRNDIEAPYGSMQELIGIGPSHNHYHMHQDKRIPGMIEEEVTRTINEEFIKNAEKEHLKTIIQKIGTYCLRSAKHTRDLPKRNKCEEVQAKLEEETIPAGHDFLGRHWGELGPDMEKDVVCCFYVITQGKRYEYHDEPIKQRGKSKIILAFNELGYVAKEEQAFIQEIKEDLKREQKDNPFFYDYDTPYGPQPQAFELRTNKDGTYVQEFVAMRNPLVNDRVKGFFDMRWYAGKVVEKGIDEENKPYILIQTDKQIGLKKNSYFDGHGLRCRVEDQHFVFEDEPDGGAEWYIHKRPLTEKELVDSEQNNSYPNNNLPF